MRDGSIQMGVALLGWLCGASLALAAEVAVEGRWWGEAVAEHETIALGIEFRRDAAGSLQARLTQPLINLYDYPLEGTVRQQGDEIEPPGLGMVLRLRGERLTGEIRQRDVRVRYAFSRSDSLPSAPSPPLMPEGPAPRWETRLNGQLWASPVASGDRVFLGSTGGVMNALDAGTGRLHWSRALSGPIHGAVSVNGEHVYVATDNGFLHKLTGADGSETWRYDLGDGEHARVLPHPTVFVWDWQAAAPLVDGDDVYVGAADGGFHAIDASSGTRRWRFDTRGAIRNAAALAGERIMVGSADGHLYALERATGREIWRFDSGAKIDTTPLVVGDLVVVGNRGKGLFAVELANGRPRWRSSFWGSWVESTPVLHEGVLYVGGSDIRRVSALDPATGKVHWRSDVFGWSFGTPLVIGDTLHVGVAGGAPYFVAHQASYSVLDRASGRLLRRRPIADPGGHQWGIVGSPIRVGDTVIVATLAGSVLAYPVEQ